MKSHQVLSSRWPDKGAELASDTPILPVPRAAGDRQTTETPTTRPGCGLAGRDQNHAHPASPQRAPRTVTPGGPETGPTWELFPQPTPASPPERGAFLRAAGEKGQGAHTRTLPASTAWRLSPVSTLISLTPRATPLGGSQPRTPAGGLGALNAPPFKAPQSLPSSAFLPFSLPFCASSAVSWRRAAAAAPW